VAPVVAPGSTPAVNLRTHAISQPIAEPIGTITNIMDLGLLRTFLAVYRAGTLSAAAPRLGLSQPAVTSQLQALESRLGRQLFHRRPRGVVPTAAADELARGIAEHLDALESVGVDADTDDPFARSVHLGGPAEFLTEMVIPALAGLVRRGLRLRITTGLAEALLAELTAGRLDLVVSTIRPRSRAVHWTPLTDEEFVLVGTADWARRLTAAIEPSAALRQAPLVAYAEDLPLIRRYWRSAFGRPPTGSAAVVVPDLRAVLAATVAGAGISVLPRYLCRAHLAAGTLVALFEPELPPINTLYLATRAGPETSPAVVAIRDELQRYSAIDGR
jgi:DNA-binding transcriptional LysR family regulator